MPPVLRESADHGGLILTVSWAEAGIAILFLAARFYTNVRVVRRLKADFYIAVLTYAIALTAQACLTVSVQHGLGQHINTLSPYQISKSLKYGWVFQIMFVACMGLGKLAIIAFLLQIRGPHEPRPWFLWFIGSTTMIVNFITIGLILAQCTPVSKLWDRDMPGTCGGLERNQHFAFFQGSWSSFCDLALALYPVYICWRLQVQLHVKVGLCVLMGLGIIAAICSAIRTSELEALSHIVDISYDISPLIIWTSTETWIILIVGCVPPIRPLFISFLQLISPSKLRSYVRSQYRYGTGQKSMQLSSIIQRKEDELSMGNQVDVSTSESTRAGDEDKEHIVRAEDRIVMTTNIDVNYGRSNIPKEATR